MDSLNVFEYFINPNKRLYFGYILSSIFIAFLFYYFTKIKTKVIFSKKLWFHKSAILDYKYFFVGYFINILFLIPFLISAKTIAFSVNKFLYFQFDFFETNFFSYNQIIFLYTLALFIASDFTRYWLHRFLHTIPFLWEFHKVHHSAKVLNPATFYRVHFVENILFGLRYSFTIGIVTGIFIYFFGAMIDIYMVAGVNILLFIFSLLGSNLRHSPVPLSYGKYLEKWFISPKQHQVHHSKKYFNKNYGGYLAIWDRIFGTLKLSSEIKTMKFGLKKEQMKEYSSLKDLIFTPFKNLINNYTRK